MYTLAWLEYQRDMHTCGHPLSVTMKPDNQFAYEAEPVRCHACAAQQRAAKQFADDGGDQAGLLLRMVRFPSELS